LPDIRILLKKYYPVVFLLIVFAVCVDMLGMVWKVAEPLIAGNEQDKIVAQLEETFLSDEGNEWVEVVVTPDDDNEYSIYVVVKNDNIINFSFMGVKFGKVGDIRVLVSFNYEVPLGEDFDPSVIASEATVEFVFVTKHVETPGIGSLVAEVEFTDLFIGLLIEEIAYPPNGDIAWITGATISSKAMIEAIREAAEARLGALPSAEEIETALLAKREAEAEE